MKNAMGNGWTLHTSKISRYLIDSVSGWLRRTPIFTKQTQAMLPRTSIITMQPIEQMWVVTKCREGPGREGALSK